MSVPTSTSGSIAVDQKPRGSTEYLEMIKKAANEFSIRERMFLMNISASDQNRLDGDNNGPKWTHTAHARHHVEIMLTLKEVKPCTLIVHGTCQDIFTKMVETCLVPVIDRHNLKDYGFLLQQITHPMPTEFHPGFQHAWIFADTRSAKWADVKNIFLTPHPGQEAKDVDIGKALGYPINRRGLQTGMIYYKDYTEKARLEKALGGEEICCVDGVEYWCAESPEEGLLDDMEAIYRHFASCSNAAQAVGWELKLKGSDYPKFKEITASIQAQAEIQTR